jgi:hypothetical protein
VHLPMFGPSCLRSLSALQRRRLRWMLLMVWGMIWSVEAEEQVCWSLSAAVRCQTAAQAGSGCASALRC